MALLLALPAGCGRNRADDDFAVAIVNGLNITASDIGIHMAQAEEMLEWEHYMMYGEWDILHTNVHLSGVTFGRAILEEAVRSAAFYTLFHDYAARLDIALSAFDQQMIDNEINRFIEHYGEAELNRLLREDGFRDYNHLAQMYASQQLLFTLLREVASNPAEFAQFAHLIPEEAIPELIGAKHILLAFSGFDSEDDALIAARGLMDRAWAGEDFDELIREYGQDPGMRSFPNGYSFTFGNMVSEFEEATLLLAIGEISGIVRSDFGFHIIKRTEPVIEDFYLFHDTQPRTLEDRMMEAVFKGLELMVENAEIEFLPELDNMGRK
jgi:hypothetical protein